MTYGGPAVSVGEQLAAARRAAGLTITQVSQRTCIRETIIRGIERGDYSACGGDFYARGHVRSIARAVGLNPDEVVAQYDATVPPPQPITAADVFQPVKPVKLRERRRPNWSVVLLAGVIALAAIVGLRYFGPHSGSGRPATAASEQAATHSAAPSASPVAAPSPKLSLTIEGKPRQVTWTQVTGSSGKVLFQGLIGPGVGAPKKSWTLSGGGSLSLKVQFGNPAAATVWLNNKKQAFDTSHPVTLTCTTQACK